jgi:hypothetical protein
MTFIKKASATAPEGWLTCEAATYMKFWGALNERLRIDLFRTTRQLTLPANPPDWIHSLERRHFPGWVDNIYLESLQRGG